MPSLFRRRSDDLTDAPEVDEAADAAEPVSPASAERRPRGYTPSKKELGVTTPKRSVAQQRRRPAAGPTDKRAQAKALREKRRAERAEAMAGMRAGDERFLMPRDRGPERALVRDIVDSRRTAGTWFFVGALIVLLGSSAAMPPAVRLASNVAWTLLALAVVVDSVLISFKIKKLVRERFPKSAQKPRSLYLYGIMRAITFRRMRVPAPRVKLGQKI